MSDTPQHQDAWDHKRAIMEYEAFLQERFRSIGVSPARLTKRKQQFQAIIENPEVWRDPDEFKRLYANLRRDILALGVVNVSLANKRIREKFGANTPHFVETHA